MTNKGLIGIYETFERFIENCWVEYQKINDEPTPDAFKEYLIGELQKKIILLEIEDDKKKDNV